MPPRHLGCTCSWRARCSAARAICMRRGGRGPRGGRRRSLGRVRGIRRPPSSLRERDSATLPSLPRSLSALQEGQMPRTDAPGAWTVMSTHDELCLNRFTKGVRCYDSLFGVFHDLTNGGPLYYHNIMRDREAPFVEGSWRRLCAHARKTKKRKNNRLLRAGNCILANHLAHLAHLTRSLKQWLQRAERPSGPLRLPRTGAAPHACSAPGARARTHAHAHAHAHARVLNFSVQDACERLINSSEQRVSLRFSAWP